MRKIATVLLLISCHYLYAQDYITSLRHWGMNEGLSDRSVKGICIDHKGMVWVATRNGLTRFDGYNFKLFNRQNAGLPFDNVRWIAEDETDDLWLLGDDHIAANIAVFDPVTCRAIPLREKLGSDSCIHAGFLTRMSDSSIFFGMHGMPQFYTWRQSRGVQKVKNPIPRGNMMECEERNSFLVYDSSRKLCEVDLRGNIVRRLNAPGNLIPNIRVQGQGRYFAERGTHNVFFADSALNIIDVTAGTPPFDDERADYIFNTGIDNTIMREGRLFRKDGSLIRDFYAEDVSSLQSRVQKVAVDQANRIWFCNDFGLFMLSIKKNKFKRYFYLDEKTNSGNSYRGITVDNGVLFACNEFKGPKEYDLQRSKIVERQLPAPGHDGDGGYIALAKLYDNSLFGISFARTLLLPATRRGWRCSQLPDDKTKLHCWSMMQTGSDSILMGTSRGLWWFNLRSKTFLPFVQYNGFGELVNSTVLHIAPDRAGHIWLCTNSGFFEYDRQTGIVARFSSKDTGCYYLPAEEFQHYCTDGDTYWLAATTGLIQWRRGSNFHRLFTRADGLSNDNIYGVYDDGIGRLWLSSDYGIMSFNKSTHFVRPFLKSNGITHDEFNRISHFRDRDGTIYFGSLNGITSFNPRDFSDSELVPAAPLVLTAYYHYDGKRRQQEDKTAELLTRNRIDLAPEDAFFTFQFALLNYGETTKNTYYWKIEGADTAWKVQAEPTLRLGSLRYGDNILRIKAQSGGGTWGRNELRFVLHVRKPFYLELWFLGLAGTVTASSLFGLYKYRVVRLKRENTRLDNVVREKTAGLEEMLQDLRVSYEQKDILLKEIHHRVKNNLQVICALLELQQANVADEHAKEVMTESTTRVRSISLIHQQLYQREHITTIEFGKFANDLLSQIASVFRNEAVEVVLNNNVPQTELDIDTAVPLGLILNELMTNSYKYAFGATQRGVIDISLQQRGNDFELVYFDNGPGLSNHVGTGTGTLGIRMMRSLSKQIGGKMDYREADKQFVISFKNEAGRKLID